MRKTKRHHLEGMNPAPVTDTFSPQLPTAGRGSRCEEARSSHQSCRAPGNRRKGCWYNHDKPLKSSFIIPVCTTNSFVWCCGPARTSVLSSEASDGSPAEGRRQSTVSVTTRVKRWWRGGLDRTRGMENRNHGLCWRGLQSAGEVGVYKHT